MRGLSTVAAFVVFLTAFAVVMFSVFYFYDVLRGETQRGVSAVQSAIVHDAPVRLMYNGSRCLLEGGPYIFYILTRGGAAVYEGPADRCPPSEKGLYRYIGVARSGDLGYADVYVGPSAADAAADRLVIFHTSMDPFTFRLYLKLYNNSSGWAPYESLNIRLTYDSTILTCKFQSTDTDATSVGPAVVSPAGLASFALGEVMCTPRAMFSHTTIGLHVEQTYATDVWPAHIPIVVHVTNSTASAGGGGGGGGGSGTCSFVASSGRRFGSPDGSPASGFNELNGWVAAWGPSGGGVRIALMPGISPPDSTNTGRIYTVELNNIQIGTLTVSGGITWVAITEPMPGFMQVVRIWLEPGGHILYDNGPRPAVILGPGAYQVRATLRAAPSSAVYGTAANLTLRCGGTPTATITLRVPNPNEWGLRADIYTYPNAPPPWPPFETGYTHRGTWSVGAMYFWLNGDPVYPDIFGLTSPYVSSYRRHDIAPKWAAYWINPAASMWQYWAIKFTGRLYVPWSNIRVGVWHDDGVYVRLCSIDTGSSWWIAFMGPQFRTASGTCTGAPGEYSIDVGYFQDYGGVVFVVIIGPGSGNEAYIPTIDGAWRCPNFNWGTGRCNVGWSFVPASSSVPHFVGWNYTPGSSDGGGTPLP